MGRLGVIRREMLKLRQEGLKWQQIADRYGVTVGMAWRVANEGYDPRSKLIREKLGLGRKRKARLEDLPVDLLRKMIEERETWS